MAVAAMVVAATVAVATAAVARAVVARAVAGTEGRRMQGKLVVMVMQVEGRNLEC